jgi:oligosaccharide repeat unit polymerase
MTCSGAASILAVLTVVNFFVGGRRALYPPFVYSLVWCLDSILFGLPLIEVDEVHSIVWCVIVLGAFCFTAGGWAAKLVPRRVLTVQVRELAHPTASNLGKLLLLLICLLGIPFLSREILTLGAGGVGGLLMNARQASIDIATAGGSLAVNPVSTYLPIFSVWLAILLLIEGADKYFWITLAISLICCVLATGRTLFLLLFVGLTYIRISKERKQSIGGALKIAFVPLLLFSVVFVAVIFLDKNLADFAGDFGAIFSSYVIAYFVGPIATLDYVLTHAVEYAFAPHHTFEFFLKGLSLLPDVSTRPPARIDEFLLVPFPANTYTLYKPLFTDFGFWGMLIAVGIVGFVQTAIYRRALHGGKIALFFSALLLYCTLMSIFDDAYTQFQQAILALILVCFYYGFLNRLKVPRRLKQIRFTLGIRMPRLRLMGRRSSI